MQYKLHEKLVAINPMKNVLMIPVVLIAVTFCDRIYGQVRNSIGIGAGINRPVKDGYGIGRDRVIQANIHLNNRLALMPILGLESIASGRELDSNTGFDTGFLNLAAKYYPGKNVFIYAGPSGYVGGNDGGVIGLGGTGGAGYNWNFDHYSSLEFSLRADVLPTHMRAGTLIGLRVAYQFNFSRKD
jgi:hypothetical protein